MWSSSLQRPALRCVSIEQTRPLPSPERTTGEAAVRTFGLELYALEASDEHGIDEVFATARRLRAGALVISADSFFVLQLAKLAALPLWHRVPTLTFLLLSGVCRRGWSDELFCRSSRLVSHRRNVLKGCQAGRPTGPTVDQVEMFINLQSARALDLTKSAGLLAMANEVIA